MVKEILFFVAYDTVSIFTEIYSYRIGTFILINLLTLVPVSSLLSL